MRAALRYPLAGDAEDRFLVAWILHLLHAVVLPVVPLLGMLGLLAATTQTAATGAAPPSFRDWRALAADAGRALVVLAAYAVPAAVVLYLVGAFIPTVENPPAGAVALLAAGLLGILLPLAYAAPASLAHAAARESLRAGFDRDAVGRTLGDADYFTRWAAGVASLGAAAAAVAVLGPYLVGHLLAAYFEVLAFACFGWGAIPTVDA
ncbi:MAG: DUF4013 domain-containing protein [Halobacterium sp.]